MPLEKKRVISSAPTNACHWRSASARRNVPPCEPLPERGRLGGKAWRGEPAQRVGLDRLVLEVVGHALDERREPGKAPGQRPCGERAARIPIRAERVDARLGSAQPRRARARRSRVERALRDRHEVDCGSAAPRCLDDPPFGEQAVDVLEHRRLVRRRRPASG